MNYQLENIAIKPLSALKLQTLFERLLALQDALVEDIEKLTLLETRLFGARETVPAPIKLADADGLLGHIENSLTFLGNYEAQIRVLVSALSTL